ncbi:MAG TPA: tol-pal system protein YbgF [Alphaproteobacteria bacterium]|nr:tol-pal system protein YbgF [Alphaproteobacteria bacterium]
MTVQNTPLTQSCRGPVRWVALSLLLAMFAAGVFGLSGGAAAQDAELRELLRRLESLEATLVDVQRELYNRSLVPRPQAAEGGQEAIDIGEVQAVAVGTGTEGRLTDMETAMSALTGDIESIGHRVDLMNGRLDRLVADVDFRLKEIEQTLRRMVQDLAALAADPAARQRPAADAGTGTPPAASAAIAPATETTAPQGPARLLPEGSPQEQYSFARSLLTRLDYEQAETAFREFLEINAGHELAGNARYWLGETYYVRGDYGRAARAFIEGFQAFPDGNKAADNLLKLGLSLGQMGQKDDACATIGELLNRFPDAEERIARRARQEQGQLGC